MTWIRARETLEAVVRILIREWGSTASLQASVVGGSGSGQSGHPCSLVTSGTRVL